MPSTRLAVLLGALALLGGVVPVAAVGLGGPLAQADTPTPAGTANGTAVNVTPGAQLATVLAATEASTRAEVDETRFELELERGGDDERAEAIAERAEALAGRAGAIREDYEAATGAYEAGELTADEYARRLAELNARAEHLIADVEALRAHADDVSGLELEAAGFDRAALRRAAEDLDPLTGVGPSAVLERFLGERTGEVELRTADGLRLEVEREDGEASIEVRRPRDDDPAITVAQDAALTTARATLPPGDWVLVRASVHADSGYYRFEFALRSADRVGEAAVRVDGSTGEVFRLEAETERPDDEDDDADHDDREAHLLLVDGTPGPGETVTVRLVADGEAVAGATVFVNDHAVAETDAHGEATVTLPRAPEVEVEAGDAELEFEFDGVDDRESVYHRLDATATLEGETATVRVTFDGEPVEGVAVEANGEAVGETSADGVVTVAFDPAEEDRLDLELAKGDFEAEFRFELRHGELVLTEAAHEVDDSSETDDDHEETPEATETDDDR